MEEKKWYIPAFTGNGFDCCDCEIPPIRIDNDIAEKYGLGKKHFRMPCPLCDKVGTWKRYGWSVCYGGDTYPSDRGNLVQDLPDMTKEALEMEIEELANRIVTEQKRISNARKEIREITYLLMKI